LQRLLANVNTALLHGLQAVFFWSAVIMAVSILPHLILKRAPLRARMSDPTSVPAAASSH
jgi:hypothetical protein